MQDAAAVLHNGQVTDVLLPLECATIGAVGPLAEALEPNVTGVEALCE